MLLLVLALLQAPFDTKADFVFLAKQHCAAEWPDDFRMQGYCLKQQAEGMVTFKAVAERSGKPLHKALEKCTKEWTKNRLPDWRMIAHCASQQEASWRSLNPSSPSQP